MGAFLEKPKTEKVTAKGEGLGIRYGVSAMQGWRMEMEDSHVCNTKFSFEGWGFFGVFDGHAGPKVSQYCSQHLLDCILESTDSDSSKGMSSDAAKEGIHKGFLKLDDRLKNLPQWASGEDRSGTTAIVVMVSPDEIIWANCGDSRGLLCRDGKLEFATEDHKPYNEKEKTRIEKAGGTVMMQRVNGSLAVSRALGDFDYKRATELPATAQLVSPEPEITVHKRESSSDEFIFLACDGVFDVMTNEEVIGYIRHHLQLTDDLAKICSDLIDTCLNKNSRDNMSAVLVTFPSAPKVSQDAIEEDRKLQSEAREKIGTRIAELVEMAQDPLDLEENHVIQTLTSDLPASFDVVNKRPFISERLQELKKEKFGNAPDDFTGPSDPFDAPVDMQGTIGGKDFFIITPMDNPPAATSGGEDVSNPLESAPTASEKEDKSANQQEEVKMDEGSDNQVIKDSSEEGKVKT